MTVQIDFWELLLALATLIGAFAGMIFSFARALGRQLETRLDERFEAQEEAREQGARTLRESIERYAGDVSTASSEIKALERDFLTWKADLPIQYVRREDYVRGQSVIEAKLDALFTEIKMVQIKGSKP